MRGKPRVKAGVKFVQGNFFAGETFLDLADARSRMTEWLGMANARVHGTTRQVPAVVFAAREAPCLLPAPAGRYQVPYWAEVKVHVDYHIQVARALYSVPWRHVGARVMARADEHLVKVYLRDQLIKTHPRKRPAAGPPMPRTCRRGWRATPPARWTAGRAGRQLRPGHRDLRAAAAGRRRAVDDDAVGLPADRAGETLRPAGGGGGLRAGPGRRRHQRLQDRVDAQERHREHPGGRAGRGGTAPVLAGSPGMRPSTPPRPGCGCRSSTAAATPPARRP